jgi:hypothetical protein
MSPHFAYRPQGNILSKKFANPLFVRVGALPKENICTENLTPWSKLLPCGFSVRHFEILTYINLLIIILASGGLDERKAVKLMRNFKTDYNFYSEA